VRWLVLFVCGCFPYRETWRPAVDGVVVDGDGAPAAARSLQIVVIYN
jgi:hypothetical protein